MQKFSKLVSAFLVLSFLMLLSVPKSQAEESPAQVSAETAASDMNSQNLTHVMVGVYEAPYPYEQKSHYLSAVKDRFQFFKQVIENWKDCISKDAVDYPEELEYCKTALPLVEEKFAKLKDAYSAAQSSGESDWMKNESELKAALRATYLTYKNQNRRIPGAN